MATCWATITWRKTYAYEGSAHIPFIVRPPASWGWPRGQVLDHVVEIRDVMPTLLEAGVRVPETVDGSSLPPLVQGGQKRPAGVIQVASMTGAIATSI